GEELPEVDVLVAVGLGAQQLVGDDARGERRDPRAETRGRALVVDALECGVEGFGEVESARGRRPGLERRAPVEEIVQVRKGGAEDTGALVGGEPDEVFDRLLNSALEEGVEHPWRVGGARPPGRLTERPLAESATLSASERCAGL